MMGQSVKKNLLLANALPYHQKLYVYGYEQSKSDLLFKCYSYDYQLKLKDSTFYNLGKHTLADYLDISIDTLHDVLNFYFQLANQKNLVSLLRLNDSLVKIASAEDYDANHVNSLAAFDDEKYASKEDLYIIRTNTDTAGKQFYLSKYHVKDMKKPFEYDYQWQFAFERKYIHRASVMYADSSQVIVYAHVFDGLKKGQWILRINARTGDIIKGSKLSAKGDPRYFLMSNMVFDKKLKSIDVIGSIYDANMIDLKNKTSNFTNQSKAHKLFLVCIDSLGDVVTRAEKVFPLPIQTKSVEGLKSFHIKVREFKKLKDNNFDAWMDVYEQSKPMIFCYYSSWHLSIIPDDVDYAFTPSKFLISTNAIPGYISFAKGDTYAKFILTDITSYDKFKYQQPMNPFVINTQVDDLDNSTYILKKTDLMTATKSYNYVAMGKKGLENKILLRSEQGQKANMLFYKKNAYISFTTNTANTEFELRSNTL
ncbi:MAG: hypothetical protein V4677_17895 [Bacteroidota bacterium]